MIARLKPRLLFYSSLGALLLLAGVLYGFGGLANRTQASRQVSLLGLALVVGLVLLLAATYAVARSTSAVLQRLGGAAKAVAGGRLDARVELEGSEELVQVAVAFNEMAAAIEERLRELEDERRRARETTSRFAEVLAATHDVRQLMRVVVETAVEVTAADGGVVIGPEGELARTGDPESGARLLELPLRAGKENFGWVVLSGESFDNGRSETAKSLVSHAVIALDNARLHTIVERQAHFDGLTGLLNRRATDDALRAALARALRLETELCLVLTDLDDFKAVNDQYGHPFGDRVLREFARTLEEVIREVDIAGRWGGEEFALVLPDVGAEEGAIVAERIRTALTAREIRAQTGDKVVLTASFGIAAFPVDGHLDALVAAADEALYSAKRTGRDRVVTAREMARR